MINCRFDFVTSHNKDADRTGMVRAKLPTVPNVGELINLNGEPFIVIDRGWAYDDGDEELWCYMRVVHPYGNKYPLGIKPIKY